MSRLVAELAPRRRPSVPIDECVDAAFLGQPPLPAFAEESIGALAEWSRRILAAPADRRRPEWAAFGFWIREANLRAMVAAARPGDPAVTLAARGVALHVAPANVDTVFLYSLALSMLAGNLNVVRISSRRVDELAEITDQLAALFASPAGEAVGKRTRIVAYGHEAAVNEYLAAAADVRVLWGGDATVAAFRRLPAKVDVKDIAFPDRFSYAAIAAAEYLACDDERVRRLAEAFYNDAYWFDQKACSSPSVVYFVGAAADCAAAGARFWPALAAVLRARRHQPPAAVQMNRLVFACQQLAEAAAARCHGLRRDEPGVAVLGEGRLPAATCGGGMFWEGRLESLEELTPLVRGEDQTLAYFGFERQTLAAWAGRLAGRGLRRIVPIGQALAFDAYWDGYPLLAELTRSITIR